MLALLTGALYFRLFVFLMKSFLFSKARILFCIHLLLRSPLKLMNEAQKFQAVSNPILALELEVDLTPHQSSIERIYYWPVGVYHAIQ